ncbi:MAG: CBS domain-containing protein [Microthrixaceae bacterium]
MLVADVLRHKGTAVTTVSPSASLAEIATVLSRQRIGAVVVSGDGTTPDGILSERDIVRHLADHGGDALHAEARSVMSPDPMTCAPGDSIELVMETMTNSRNRHLPVMVDGRLAGIVSIGDAVARRVAELETERSQLHDYIATGR